MYIYSIITKVVQKVLSLIKKKAFCKKSLVSTLNHYI